MTNCAISAQRECLTSPDILCEIVHWLAESTKDVTNFHLVNSLFYKTGRVALFYNPSCRLSKVDRFNEIIKQNPQHLRNIYSMAIKVDTFCTFDETADGIIPVPKPQYSILHDVLLQIMRRGRLSKFSMTSAGKLTVLENWHTFSPLFTMHSLRELSMQLNLTRNLLGEMMDLFKTSKLSNLDVLRMDLSALPFDHEHHGGNANNGNYEYSADLARTLVCLPRGPKHLSLAFNFETDRSAVVSHWNTILKDCKHKPIWPALISLDLTAMVRVNTISTMLVLAANVQRLRVYGGAPRTCIKEDNYASNRSRRGNDVNKERINFSVCTDLRALDIGASSFILPQPMTIAQSSSIQNIVHLRIRNLLTCGSKGPDQINILKTILGEMTSLRCLDINWCRRSHPALVHVLEGRDHERLKVVWAELREIVIRMRDYGHQPGGQTTPMERLLEILHSSRMSMPKLLAVTIEDDNERETMRGSGSTRQPEFGADSDSDSDSDLDGVERKPKTWLGCNADSELEPDFEPYGRCTTEFRQPSIIFDNLGVFPPALRFLSWRVSGRTRLYRIGWKVGQSKRTLAGDAAGTCTPSGRRLAPPEPQVGTNAAAHLQRMFHADSQIAKGDTSICNHKGSLRYAVKIPRKFAKKRSEGQDWDDWTDSGWFTHLAGEEAYED